MMSIYRHHSNKKIIVFQTMHEYNIFFTFQWLSWIFGVRDFLPSSFVTRSLARYVCEDDLGSEWCTNIMFVLCGYDKAQLNEVRNPNNSSKTNANMFYFLPKALILKIEAVVTLFTSRRAYQSTQLILPQEHPSKMSHILHR